METITITITEYKEILEKAIKTEILLRMAKKEKYFGRQDVLSILEEDTNEND